MIEFMFATLGAVGFWLLYFAMSLIAVVIILRTIALETYAFVTTGHLPKKCYAIEYYIVIVLNMIFWPAVLACIFGCFIISRVLLPIIVKAIAVVDKAVPTVKFENKDNTLKEEKDSD